MSPERWQQIEPILDEALALPTHERSAFLQRACHGDASLRAEVETFLLEKSRASDFLEQPVFALPSDLKQAGISTQPNTSSIVTTPPLVGQQLGSYKILSLLGKGGMGEVYLARDTRLDREVAIKLLPAQLARDPEREERFKREARLQARLDNHQNIALIHALEQSDDASFLVLEYVPGDTLADRLQRGALNVAEALPLFRQIADALATAHQQGVIHRDLKPANIKITPSGQIKVLDFGLAKLLHNEAPTAEEANALLTTRTYWTTDRQVIIGTVPYMSPEQTYGQELDQRTDIWAFGCVLYEALTGQRPFTGRDTFDLFNAIRKQEPDWGRLPTETSPALRKLLQQCLQKEADARLISAREAQAVLAAEENAQQARLIVVLKHWKKQIALAVAACLVIVPGALYYQPIKSWLSAKRTTAPPPPLIPKDKTLVIFPFKEAGTTEEDKVGRGLAKALQDVLASVTDLRVLPFAEAAQANLLTVAPERVMKSLGVNLLLQGEVKREAGTVKIEYWVQNSQGQRLLSGFATGQSHEYARLQTEIAAQVTNALQISPATLQTPVQFKNAAAEETYFQTLNALQTDLTATTIEPVIQALQKLHETESNSAVVAATLAQAYFRKAILSTDPAATHNAIRLAERAAQANDHNSVAAPEIEVLRGQSLVALGDDARAMESFIRARKLQPANLDALIGLAGAYQDSNRLQEAEDTFKSASQIFWPSNWRSHNELGNFYFDQGRYTEAEQEYLKAIAFNPDSTSGYINLGAAHLELGKFGLADNAFDQASRKLATTAQTSEDLFINWSTAQFYLRNYERAAALSKDGLQLNERMPALWNNRGDALYHFPDRQRKAFEAYGKAIAILKNVRLSASWQARLAELYAKRSRIALDENADATQTADGREAQLLIRRALTPTSPDRVLPLAVEESAVAVYEFTGDRKKALAHLDKALELGLSLARWEQHPDFENLRLDPDYSEILKKHRKAS